MTFLGNRALFKQRLFQNIFNIIVTNIRLIQSVTGLFDKCNKFCPIQYGLPLKK